MIQNATNDPSGNILRRGVSFLSIITDNAAWDWGATKRRFDSVLSAIRRYRLEGRAEILCTDNSDTPLRYVEDYLKSSYRPVAWAYEWCHGYNQLYGLALNRMIQRAKHPTVVYFCTNHGRFFDDSWLADLVAPLADKFCAMSGSIAPCMLSAIAEATGGFPDIHIQGGLYAAKTNILRKHPYSYKLPHVFSDLWITWKLLSEGYEVSDVPTVKATNGERVSKPERYKYVHDHFV